MSDLNAQLTTISSDPNLTFPGIDSEVLAVAGIDVEPAYNPTYVTDHWFAGYNGANVQNKEIVYIIGSADNCPTDYPSLNVQYPSSINPGPCYPGWTQDDLYEVTWGLPFSWPFPQIYRTDESNAEEWRRIAIYANAKYNSKMAFKGEMTTLEACNQTNADCSTIDNSPAVGFSQLYNRIFGDNRIINLMIWSTDIRYSGGYEQ